MKHRIIAWVLLLCLCLAGCAAGTNNENQDDAGKSRTVTDLLGRTVTVPADPQRVVCIGAGALRLYSYIGDMSRLCGVEACEKGFLISVRPYQSVHEELFRSLPSVGAGGPQGAPDAEALLAVHPDVIFSLYTSDSAAMDELQNKTGVPVVVCSYGKTEAFDTAITQSLTLMGEVLGRKERAKTVTDYIESIRTDLDRRTRDIPDAEKPTVYLGCQSNYGTHGLGSSTAGYALFDAVHARNVLDEAGYSGYQKALDTETLLTLDPEIIIIDAGGLALFLEEYKKDPTVYDSMRAVKTGEIYLQMPYNAYYTNLEIAFADAYFIGKTLYPDAFADVDAAQKFDEFSRALLGEDCYKTVAAQMYGGYGKLDPALLR